MTKRICSIVLLIAMLATMIVMPVCAVAEENGGTTAVTDACPCGCGSSLEQVDWQAYDPNAAGGVTSGHYYLDGDYVQSTQFNINANASVVLDLRGCTLTTKGYKRLYLLNGYMAVLDTVGGGVISSKTGGDAYGGVVMMSYEDTDSGNRPVFELYSGTLTADPDNKGGRRGGLVSVGSKSTFNMYGGIVMNGSAEAKAEEEGGCIAATTSSATIRIEGGTVMGGSASGHGGNIYSSGGTTILKNCRILGGLSTLNGGNIYQTGGSLTIENCVIADGSAGGSYGGGNICAQSGAEVTIRNTTIRNGYGVKQGGNIYFGSGNQLLENTTVTAGVCGTNGGNMRITGNSVTTLDRCTVSGDVSVSGTLTLKGATKIGLNNNGLNLIVSGNTKAVNASGLTEGAEIYVNADGLFTDSGAKAEYFKPAIRTVISETPEGLVGTQATDGEVGGYCPHCDQQVSWQAFDAKTYLVKECLLDSTGDTDPACTGRHMATGHYYLTETYTSFSQMYTGASSDGKTMSADVVIDLNGCSITASGRAFYIKPTSPAVSTLSLMDSVGGSVVTCKGAKGQGGGMVYSEKGNLNIYGGKYVYATGKEINAGGLIYSGIETHIYGGIFDASAYSRTGYNGGVAQMSSGANKKFTVTAGHFTGGTAKNGGVLYIGGNVAVNITGGQFRNGNAAEAGGNIQIAGTSDNNIGTVSVSGAYMTGGHADTDAGNLHITYYKEAKVENCYITKGSADSYAGNVALGSNNTVVTYEDCIITDGTAPKGGNLYSYGLSSRASLTNCLILGGQATNQGGNLSAVNGYIDVIGGMIANGSAANSGGNVYATLGNNESAPGNYLQLDGGVQITGGSAKDGGNIYFGGVVKLVDAFVNNGSAAERGQDICMVKGSLQTVLALGENARGNVSMYITDTLLGTPVYGNAVAGTQATKLNMGITLEGDYGQPQLCVKNGQLAVAGAAVGVQWYADVADAVAACGETEYVTLYTDSQLELNGDAMIDLQGRVLTVSGTGTLYGMDSTGNGGILPTGKLITGDGIAVSEYTQTPNGQLYVTVTENGESTFHHLDMAITGASIRPSVSGIYYTGTWNYDAVLAEKLNTCGVAVSLVAPPTDDFMTDGTSLWTETTNSCLISGILGAERTAEENDIYGRTSIFASAYVTLKSGTILTSREANYSIYSILKQLEAWTDVDPNQYSKLLLPARNFYKTWKDQGMGDWDLAKIPGKADDGKLDILFIGNSFTWYGKCVLDKGQNAWSLTNRINDQGYFYQVCKANGVEASVTNFTFGGHQLSDWYSHKCDADRGHNGLDHLAFLTDRDYDYVVLQQGSAGSGTADILAECQPLMDLFREVNPDTQFVFLVHHRVHQTDTSYRSRIKELEAAGVLVVDWGKLVADVIDGTTQVPGATQTYNNNSFVIRKSESDGYHENMLGGYITAQMLYCAITGESAVGQDYSFCGDTSVNKAFDFDKFLKEEYSYDNATSNFIEIFNSPEDMLGLQQLMDQYLAAKPYLNY